MKKTSLAAALAVTLALTACGSTGNASTTTSSDATATAASAGKVQVVATTFPQYDWVNQLIKGAEDDFEVSLLLDNGTDLHSFNPTAADILKVGSSDVFIYVGGESDVWVEDAMKEKTNADQIEINLVEALGDAAKTEEMVEGMQDSEPHHDHDHEESEVHEHEHAEGETHAEGEAHEHEHEEEIDEHVWLSLKNAQIFVDDIAEALIAASPENADLIKANAENYVAQLKDLDAQYQATVDSAKVKTVLFADRFPFRYLVDDYNLEYYAAFLGCSAETEASFETVVFLAGKVDECGLGTILVIENSDQKIAETIRSNTTGKNQEIAVLDSLQSTNKDDIAAGKNYLDTMTSNLEVLKKALN